MGFHFTVLTYTPTCDKVISIFALPYNVVSSDNKLFLKNTYKMLQESGCVGYTKLMLDGSVAKPT